MTVDNKILIFIHIPFLLFMGLYLLWLGKMETEIYDKIYFFLFGLTATFGSIIILFLTIFCY